MAILDSQNYQDEQKYPPFPHFRNILRDDPLFGSVGLSMYTTSATSL
jgi:hypothetical protein